MVAVKLVKSTNRSKPLFRRWMLKVVRPRHKLNRPSRRRIVEPFKVAAQDPRSAKLVAPGCHKLAEPWMCNVLMILDTVKKSVCYSSGQHMPHVLYTESRHQCL